MNTEIILILALFMLNSKDKGFKELHMVKDYIGNMDIDPIYTEQKINIVRKITPLLPNEYIKPVEQSVLYALSIVKIMEIKNIFSQTDNIKTKAVVVEDNKDRLNKIMGILKEESLKTDFSNVGMAMNIISNLDKYKNLLNVFMKLNNNKKEAKDNNDLIEIAQSFMGKGKDEKEAKEMQKIIQIINLLNSPKKENNSQSAKNE